MQGREPQNSAHLRSCSGAGDGKGGSIEQACEDMEWLAWVGSNEGWSPGGGLSAGEREEGLLPRRWGGVFRGGIWSCT